MSESSHTLTKKQTFNLVGDQTLEIEHYKEENVLKIVGSDGLIKLTVQITEAGPLLRLEGAGLMIQTDGIVGIDAEQVAIHGRKGISMTSDGDVRLHTTGDFHSNARTQNISADLGDTRINANDDVKLEGERIRMNC